MRIALVTGGSRGLGQALCKRLNAGGYRVYEFSRTSPYAFSTRLDFSSPSNLDGLVEALSGIDASACSELLAISNAGILSPIGPAWSRDSQQVLANLNINLVSAIRFISEVVRHFRSSPGRKIIVNVSSGAALKGYAGWSLYCAAKAGMENFVRAIAAEEQLQDQPFIPVSVDPGVIDTDMQAQIRESAVSDFPEVERFRKRHDAGGLAPPDEVARAIIDLANRQDLQPGARYDLPTGA
jgi:benzil reductase ((S)-benzoin forming)